MVPQVDASPPSPRMSSSSGPQDHALEQRVGVTPSAAQTIDLGSWMKMVQAQVERTMERLLRLADEEEFDLSWNQALEHLRSYSLRASKRLRPGLVLAGYAFARGDTQVPPGLWRFAAATELLHSFMLIHDDVADQAEVRRGAPTLHRMLGEGKHGEDLAIIAGDHLFSRSIEIMLTSNLPNAPGAVKYYLSVCRHTAVGQFMDLTFSHEPLSAVTLFRTLKVATLKTALYGFTAPLVCGAMLGRGEPSLIGDLDRIGRHIGIAYQLRDDLIGLYGQADVCGKSTDSDLVQGKRTFPVLFAYTRANEAEKREMAELWTAGPKDQAMLDRARQLVDANGGRNATERLILRSTRAAERLLVNLPKANGLRDLVAQLAKKLAHRDY